MPQLDQTINRPVFFTSALFTVLLVVLTVLFTEPMGEFLSALQTGIVSNFGWFYILVVAGFLFFVLYLFFSRFGAMKLGGDDEEAEFSYPTWFAMLFSAGMGIGLIFYGVAEPILHFTAPLESQPGTVRAAREAMQLTFFHWGLHAWAIYIVVGLSLAYFAYRHNLPLTIRSTLYPLLGQRINGPIGHLVEVLAILGTLFGVATSLGLGVSQINAGLDHLGVLPDSLTNQLLLIGGITLLATISVVSGLEKGIRRLSEMNLGIAGLLLVFVLLAGPTVFLLSTFVQSIGNYVQTLIAMSFRTSAFRGIEWQASWTMFYWGWWISWSPFVGMFIARISRGRTIREFIAGALFAPTLLGFLWFTVFGSTAIHMELFGQGGIADAVAASVPTALFIMLEQLPLAAITSTLAVLVIATFFITSSDSGSLVIDILSTNGNPNPPVATRIFWAVSEGGIAAVLLLAGGLGALQTAAITSALPFSIVMIFMCLSLMKGLRAEGARLPRLSHPVAAGPDLVPGVGAPDPDMPAADVHWRDQLKGILGRQAQIRPQAPELAACRDQIRHFMQEAETALNSVAGELRKSGREVSLDRHAYQMTLTVINQGREEFSYTLRGRTYRKTPFAFPELRSESPQFACRVEIILRGGVVNEVEAAEFDRDHVIRNFLAEYAKWVGW